MSTLTPTIARLVPVTSQGTVTDRKIMVRHYKNQDPDKVTVIFVPGFMSNGQGTKGVHLVGHCQQKGYNYICYDPEGLGESIGELSTVKFEHWFEDLQTVLKFANQESEDCKIVVVGSSMGGWISLKVYDEFKHSIKGLVMVAPALNFMWPMYQDWYKQLSAENQKKLDSGEDVPLDRGTYVFMVKRDFALQSRKMEFDLTKKIQVDCPVRIIHGVQDETIPHQRSLQVLDLLSTQDVTLTYMKDSLHQMTAPKDLKLLSDTLDLLIKDLEEKQ